MGRGTGYQSKLYIKKKLIYLYVCVVMNHFKILAFVLKKKKWK